MINLGEKKSAIRENFAYGRQRMEQIEKEKVFDFSLGNPNVPAPAGVRRAMEKYAADCGAGRVLPDTISANTVKRPISDSKRRLLSGEWRCDLLILI